MNNTEAKQRNPMFTHSAASTMQYVSSFLWLAEHIGDMRFLQIFFDAVPFHGNSDVQVVRLVTNGVRPIRLGSPRMANSTWDLIQISWKSIPSERPKMEQIVTMLTSFAQARSSD